MTSTQTESATMKAEARRKRSQKLQNAAIERLNVARQQAQIFLGHAWIYDWLTGEMELIERSVEAAHRAFNVPITDEDREPETLADELHDVREELARMQSALAVIAENGNGKARAVAREALGLDMETARVVDIMEHKAVEEEMPQPPTMQ